MRLLRAPCVRDVNLVAPIVLMGVANVISTCNVWGPRFADSWIKIGLNFASKGSKQVGVVVKGTPGYAYAETVGHMRAGQRRLKVCLAWGSNWHQRWRGNNLSTPHKLELKWALKVWIPFSVMLQRWSWGGTSCYIIWFFLIVALNSVEHSLLST